MKAGVMCGEKWYRFASWRRYPLFRMFNEAYDVGVCIGPIMIWRNVCQHENLRCIHGDEIMQTLRRVWAMDGGEVARVACKDCGLYLYGRPILPKCSIHGFRHIR